jgi:hypothetical protein
MATAFLSLSNLFAALHDLLAWFAPRPAATVSRPAAATVRHPMLSEAKPLRVVRVLEPSASRAVAGRMVISGRMADVCAELDRLAAQEALAHS